MVGLPALPGAALALAAYLLPESPRCVGPFGAYKLQDRYIPEALHPLCAGPCLRQQ